MSKHNLLIEKTLNTGEKFIKKVSIKTSPAHWKGTYQPILIPFSIHSRIYDGFEGDFKIAALLNYIKKNVNGKITVLFCEGAHLNTHSIQFGNDRDRALKDCLNDTMLLFNRFRSYLENYEVVFWSDLITNSTYYSFCREKIEQLYHSHLEFRLCIDCDAEETYTKDRAIEYQNRELYIEMSKLDQLEMCVSLLIFAKNGYKYQFYPGKSLRSFTFVNKNILQHGLTWVNVRLGNPKDNLIVLT